MADSIRHYRLAPLSPVHIGSGERLAPEDYVVRDEELIRLDPHSILRSLTDEARKKYESLLDHNDLSGALSFLRDAFAADEGHTPSGRSHFERYRVRLGRTSAREISAVVENPRRRGEIHALPRNPYTGDIVVPGSSIKGAIRTALLSERVQPQQDRIRRQITGARGLRRSRVLEEMGFNYGSGKTESDPLRLLEVSDASWPAGAVRIDYAALEKLGRAPAASEGIQLHLERLLSTADVAELPECAVRIQLNTEGQENRRVRALVQQPVTWGELELACNRFYTGRFNAEMHQFRDLLPDIQRWYPELRSGMILLRVGRHCHFDSLSVDGLREGFNARTKQPIREIGSTRTLCELAGGGRAPFGWMVLTPVG